MVIMQDPILNSSISNTTPPGPSGGGGSSGGSGSGGDNDRNNGASLVTQEPSSSSSKSLTKELNEIRFADLSSRKRFLKERVERSDVWEEDEGDEEEGIGEVGEGKGGQKMNGIVKKEVDKEKLEEEEEEEEGLEEEEEDDGEWPLREVTLPQGHWTLLPIIDRCNNFTFPKIPHSSSSPSSESSTIWTIEACQSRYRDALAEGKIMHHSQIFDDENAPPSTAKATPTNTNPNLAKTGESNSSSQQHHSFDDEFLVPFFIALPKPEKSAGGRSPSPTDPFASGDMAEMFPHAYENESLNDSSSTTSSSNEHNYDPLGFQESHMAAGGAGSSPNSNSMGDAIPSPKRVPPSPAQVSAWSEKPIGWLRPCVVRALLKDNEKMKSMKCRTCWATIDIGGSGSASAGGEKTQASTSLTPRPTTTQRYAASSGSAANSTSRPSFLETYGGARFSDRRYSNNTTGRLSNRITTGSSSLWQGRRSSERRWSSGFKRVDEDVNTNNNHNHNRDQNYHDQKVQSGGGGEEVEGIKGVCAIAFEDWINSEDEGEDSPEKIRKEHIERVARVWKEKKLFPEVLRGWRNELYPIYAPRPRPHHHQSTHSSDDVEEEEGNPLGNTVAFLMERSATALFSFPTFGVHMTGYTNEDPPRVWVPRRAKTKQTWPYYLDNTVAGGITEGDTPRDAMIRECAEEASLSIPFVRRNLRATGLVSYIYRTAAGWIQPEVQFVYDLEFPPPGKKDPRSRRQIIPKTNPKDNEVDSFSLLTLGQIVDLMFQKDQYKPNCAVVMVDWLIRHHYVSSASDGRFLEVCQRIRSAFDLPGP